MAPARDAQLVASHPAAHPLDAQLLDALDAALLSLLQRAPLGTPAELAQAAELALQLALDAAGAAVAASGAADEASAGAAAAGDAAAGDAAAGDAAAGDAAAGDAAAGDAAPADAAPGDAAEDDAARPAAHVAAGAAADQAAHAAAKLSAERTGLACAMERCLELIGEGLVDPGVALPALAMAAHSARATYLPAVAAARYEIETLLPIPGKATAIKKSLDVPAASLVRRPLRVSGETVWPGTAAGAGEAGASREGRALQGTSEPATAGGPVGAAVAPHRLEALWSAHPAAAVSLVRAARQRLRA